MKTMIQLVKLWEEFGDIPTKEDDSCDFLCLDATFLHFGKGTDVYDIWHWFESQNDLFVCGEMMQHNSKYSDDVHVRETAELDPEAAENFPKDWFINYADCSHDDFDTEEEACKAQRDYRRLIGLDPWTGEEPK